MNLIQGDCLEEMAKLELGSIDMVMTDPPYGTTACKWDSIIPLEPMWEQLKRLIKPNGAIVMTASQPFTTTLIASNMKMFKYCWVWDKKQGTGFLNAKKQPLRSCEDVVVFYGKQCTYNPQMRTGFKPYKCKQGATKTQNYGKQTGAITISNGDRYPLSRIEFLRDSNKQHPTQKPVALMEYLIKTYTNECETVLDFTMGSGTTGVACKNLNRNFIGIEKDPEYFKIAEERIASA
jgi:site-specific DNA-methyltransferase (adenine-specific)